MVGRGEDVIVLGVYAVKSEVSLVGIVAFDGMHLFDEGPTGEVAVDNHFEDIVV